MRTKMNVVIVGYSTFSWELAAQLRGQVDGRLYFVLPDWDQAMEASLQENVIAVSGDITDTAVLDQLDLEHCHTFVAGSREDQANVLCALYAKNMGAHHVYARVFETKFMPLMDSVGITPIQTSHTAAAFMAISILKPSVAELVSLTRGQFNLEEIQAADFPDLVGCRLGNLQGKQLHIIAVANGDDIRLGYNAVIEPGSTLIIIYDHEIRKRLHQELRKVADYAQRVGDQ
jgi:trk system potassium uptake protein TrkA